jgi:hypothetical protein
VKIIELPDSNGTIELSLTTYPKTDSIDYKVNTSINEKSTLRVDTIFIKTQLNTISYVNTSPKFLISAGLESRFEDQTEINKRVSFTYNYGISFINIYATGGIYNRVNEGINNIKLFANVGINIPMY